MSATPYGTTEAPKQAQPMPLPPSFRWGKGPNTYGQAKEIFGDYEDEEPEWYIDDDSKEEPYFIMF